MTALANLIAISYDEKLTRERDISETTTTYRIEKIFDKKEFCLFSAKEIFLLLITMYDDGGMCLQISASRYHFNYS